VVRDWLRAAQRNVTGQHGSPNTVWDVHDPKQDVKRLDALSAERFGALLGRRDGGPGVGGEALEYRRDGARPRRRTIRADAQGIAHGLIGTNRCSGRWISSGDHRPDIDDSEFAQR